MFPAPTRTFQILQLLTFTFFSSPHVCLLLSVLFVLFFCHFHPLDRGFYFTLSRACLSFTALFLLPSSFPLHPLFFPSLSSCLTCFPYQGIRGDIKSPAALTLFGASASLSLSLSLSSLHPMPLSVLSSISPSHEGLGEDSVSCEVGCWF